MNENPYSRLAALMKPSEERELFLRLGTVAGVSPDPAGRRAFDRERAAFLQYLPSF